MDYFIFLKLPFMALMATVIVCLAWKDLLPTKATVLFALLLFVAPILSLVSIRLGFPLWVANLTSPLFMLLILLLPPAILYHLLKWSVRRFVSHCQGRMPRWLHWGHPLLVLSYLSAALVVGHLPPAVEEITLSAPHIAQPTRIVQLSDLHIGPALNQARLEKIIAQTNALQADLIVITGDTVDYHLPMIRHEIARLAKLRARWGVWIVLGNHEYYHDPEIALALYQQAGLKTLVNESKLVTDHLRISGLDDQNAPLLGGTGPIYPLFPERKEAKPFHLVLAHQPKTINILRPHLGQIDLILMGHTHGGQIFPYDFFVWLVQPFWRGLSTLQTNDHVTSLYVNRGTGAWGAAIRFPLPSEITLINIMP